MSFLTTPLLTANPRFNRPASGSYTAYVGTFSYTELGSAQPEPELWGTRPCPAGSQSRASGAVFRSGRRWRSGVEPEKVSGDGG